ncbi:MAG: adenylate/guanylate cyclase domain-containing protein [Terrimicrobiaceae bacterium]
MLLAGAQAATLLLVTAVERKHAQERIRAEVEEATRVFVQFVSQTVKHLGLAVRLVSSDYAFASTFAQLRDSHDPVARATLESALQNYRARIGLASFIRLISADGRTLADSLPAEASAKLAIDESLILHAEETPGLQATQVEKLGDALHMVVVYPLLAPEPSVWIAVGFPLDAALAEEFRRLSGFEIAFLHDGKVAACTPVLKHAEIDFALASDSPARELQTLDIHGTPYLGLTVPFPEDIDGRTQIAMLRSFDEEMAPFRQLERVLILLNIGALLVSGIAGVFVARGVTRPLISLSEGVRKIMRGDYRARVPVASRDELGDLASAFNSMAIGLEERDKVHDLLGKSVSPEVARELMKSEIELGGEIREVTILFSDLRGFTALSETQSPQALVEQLNTYFTAVTSAIESVGGVVDKYIGDAVMAIFGAPVGVPDHADRAVRAALAILQAEETLNLQRGGEGLPAFRTGIGISTGAVVVGNVGSASRHNYTVIGNEVNLASRLQSLTKRETYRARIICSDATRSALEGAYSLRDLGETEIRGKKEALRIWAVDSTSPSLSPAVRGS